jgi:hypothetical protein
MAVRDRIKEPDAWKICESRSRSDEVRGRNFGQVRGEVERDAGGVEWVGGRVPTWRDRPGEITKDRVLARLGESTRRVTRLLRYFTSSDSFPTT